MSLKVKHEEQFDFFTNVFYVLGVLDDIFFFFFLTWRIIH